ncbi:2-dehydropantoate 2-reductase N-terminal domain-containing protein, partial [Staphylococcus aureus]|uniref:2-dehydropantoate 2-reductase N-terminal domain-containing protein n=1 Tax=Staphylococcus aureus TaxID=1280 RepID=UPI00241365A9
MLSVAIIGPGAVGTTIAYELQQSLPHTLKLYQETNANAIKAEGAHITPFIEKATAIGIPVV